MDLYAVLRALEALSAARERDFGPEDGPLVAAHRAMVQSARELSRSMRERLETYERHPPRPMPPDVGGRPLN